MGKEANISISGVALSTGQSMTVRVALQHFGLWLQENGLGVEGEELKLGYLRAIHEMNQLISLTAK